MKRHLSILAIALLTALACAKVENFVEPVKDSPISFAWYSNRTSAATKADPTYFVGDETVTGTQRHLPSGTSFGVFGYFHAQQSGVAGSWNDATPNYPNLFYNEAVSVTENSGSYTYNYANSRFWPKNELDRISFIAYYPYNPHLNTDGSQNDNIIVEPVLDTRNQHNGMVSFNYRTPDDSDQAVDFMISDLCVDQSKAVWDNDASHATGITGADGTENGTRVRFFFHHALTQVRVKSINFDTSGNPDIEVKVDSVKFNGIYVYGNCQPVPATLANGNTQPDPTGKGRVEVSEEWSNLMDYRPGPKHKSGVKAHSCYDDSDNFLPENILLLIPQNPFPAGASIAVHYTLTRTKDGQTDEEYTYSNNVLSAPLTNPKVYGWDAGMIYTYNISLNLKSISFTADVVPWLVSGEDVFLEETTTP